MEAEGSSKAQVLRSLARVVRGLSALFWGLPIALLVSANTDTLAWIKPHSPFIPVAAHGLILFGLIQLRSFQPGQRTWMRSVERAQILAITNLGMSPFVFFWNRVPEVPLFSSAVILLVFSGLALLYCLNHVLQRLTAMLPDEMLREETLVFSRLNRYLLIVVAILFGTYLALSANSGALSAPMVRIMTLLDHTRNVLVVFFVLLPLALTLTLIWKVKETIFQSVFDAAE